MARLDRYRYYGQTLYSEGRSRWSAKSEKKLWKYLNSLNISGLFTSNSPDRIHPEKQTHVGTFNELHFKVSVYQK